MVKHTQTIRQQKPTNFLSAFDNWMWLTHKGLKTIQAPSAKFYSIMLDLKMFVN